MKNRLYDLRTERNLLQEDLAKQINYSQQIISHYESGKNQKVSIEFENAICDYFGCSLDYLRCRSDIRNEQKYDDTLTEMKKDKTLQMKNLPLFLSSSHNSKICSKSFRSSIIYWNYLLSIPL